jgi:putative flippase GtrA
MKPLGFRVNPLALRLLRYGVVGVVVMVFFAGMNWVLGHALSKDWAFLVAYPPAVALHFWLNKTWTFGCARTDSGKQMSEYAVMVGVTFLIQWAVFKILTGLTAVPGWFAASAANAAQMIVTFLAMQLRIFKSDPEL